MTPEQRAGLDALASPRKLAAPGEYLRALLTVGLAILDRLPPAAPTTVAAPPPEPSPEAPAPAPTDAPTRGKRKR